MNNSIQLEGIVETFLKSLFVLITVFIVVTARADSFIVVGANEGLFLCDLDDTSCHRFTYHPDSNDGPIDKPSGYIAKVGEYIFVGLCNDYIIKFHCNSWQDFSLRNQWYNLWGYIGFSELIRCNVTNRICNKWGDFSYRSITSMVTYGKFVYVGLGNGDIERCRVNEPYYCELFNSARGRIYTLIVANNYIYAGVKDSGLMWRCSSTVKDSCMTFNELDAHIWALASIPPHIYAVLANGKLLKCSDREKNSCEELDYAGKTIFSISIPGYDSTGKIRALTSLNATLYAGLTDGILWECESKYSDRCKDIYVGGSGIESVTNGDGLIFVGTDEGEVYECDVDEVPTCRLLTSEIGRVRSVVYVGGLERW